MADKHLVDSMSHSINWLVLKPQLELERLTSQTEALYASGHSGCTVDDTMRWALRLAFGEFTYPAHFTGASKSNETARPFSKIRAAWLHLRLQTLEQLFHSPYMFEVY